MGFLKAGLGLGFFLDGVTQKQVNDARNGRKIQREEENASSCRYLRRVTGQAISQEIIEKTGERGQENVGKEPGQRFPDAEEKDCADGGEQTPQAGAAGRDEVADTPLHGEGRKKEERQLCVAEQIKIAAAEVIEQIADQQQLENEGG